MKLKHDYAVKLRKDKTNLGNLILTRVNRIHVRGIGNIHFEEHAQVVERLKLQVLLKK